MVQGGRDSFKLEEFIMSDAPHGVYEEGFAHTRWDTCPKCECDYPVGTKHYCEKPKNFDPMIFCEVCGCGFTDGIIYKNGHVFLCHDCKDHFKEVAVKDCAQARYKKTQSMEPCGRPYGYGIKECPIKTLDECHGLGICSKSE